MEFVEDTIVDTIVEDTIPRDNEYVMQEKKGCFKKKVL